MSERILRTHDKELYLQENRYEQPKEVFKAIAELAFASGALQENSIVYDLGCAAGEFLYYLSHRFPKAKYYGFEPVPELIEKARAMAPNAEFRMGSVLDKGIVPTSSADITFMLGVHSIFDEFETCFSNLISWTRAGGRVFVLGLFNPYPVDVYVKYRLIDDADPSHREPGWNAFAKDSVSRWLDRIVGQNNYRFTPFRMPFDLAPNQEDCVRTWTFLDKDNNRLFTNGLSLIVNLEILEIML